MTTKQVVVEKEVELPAGFQAYIQEKIEKNGDGGRPHLVSKLAKKGFDPTQAILDILELAWLQSRNPRKIARKIKAEKQVSVGHLTIYRLLQDLEPFKMEIVAYISKVPRRKVFWNRSMDTSDYATVQAFIVRAKQPPYVRAYKDRLRGALRIWRQLKYKDPAKWVRSEVLDALQTVTNGKGPAMSNLLDCIRTVAPQIRDKNNPNYISTVWFRDQIKRRKKDLFKKELLMVFVALQFNGMEFHETIVKLHVQLGAREGPDRKAGMTGIKWSNFKAGFTKMDLYESKTKGGIWCRDCPLDHLFADLPERLRKLWMDRGKPTEDFFIDGGYKELLQVYKEIRQAVSEYWDGKTDPSLVKEFGTLKPHDADKIHCNLYWEAGTPLEVLAGDYLGQGEGLGLCGRIWLSLNTIKKHYLSLTQRSDRFKKIVRKVKKYSKDFNGGDQA